MPASVWIINLVVLSAVYEADLGHRKIAWFRLARPVILASAIIAFYLKGIATRGDGLTFELVLAALGIALGLAAGALFRVSRDRRGVAWSQAGVAYAALWAAVIGARLGFAYATSHSHSVQHWMATHHISPNTITDALIFMAAGMLLARTASLLLRARTAPAAEAVQAAAEVHPVSLAPSR
jgi:hypothetical protein